MKCRKELCAAAVCFLLALLCFAARLRTGGEELADRIAPRLLRFHILANSNSAADQALKLEVKNLLLEKLADELAEYSPAGINALESDEAGAGNQSGSGTISKDIINSAAQTPENKFSEISDKEKICRCVASHRQELENAAADYMAAKGYDYGASIRITRCYFPTKYYGDIVLPCGTYDAVQVTLGNGRGRNWWCLIYPSLCFIDATHAVVPEKSKEELRCLVGEDDYAALLAQDGVKIHIRSKLFDLLAELLKTKNTDTSPAGTD